jgi:diguanylate cyclase (GGDEF)-like protein
MSQAAFSIENLLLALGVLGVLYSMYRRKPEPQLLAWQAIWAAMALHYAFQQIRIQTQSNWAALPERWFFFLSALAFLYAAREYGGRRLSAGWVLGLCAAGTAFQAAQFWWAGLRSAAGPYWAAGALAIWGAMEFWLSRRQKPSAAVKLLAFVGLFFALAAFFSPLVRSPGGREYLALGTALWTFTLLLLAVGLLMLAFEAVQRRVETNMMSFSMLSLASGGLQPQAGLAGMLDRVLERVLEVFRAECALLIVHPGEREPAPRVARNLPPELVQLWEDQDLDQFLSKKLSGFGGLLLIRDLDDPGALRLLDSDPQFESFQRVLRERSVRSVLCLSLRTAKQVYGTLLLGRTAPRADSAAELRLLRSLGVQVGMGIENFLLMKHFSRRTEELNLLNQTGQALISTRDTDTLLRRLHQELQKLMDARNFYVAILDEASNEIRFELEVDNGAYQPRRARKKGHALTEHILETGQPTLIREDVIGYREKRGIELSGRPARSWCGVPIVIRGQAAGVMAVQNYERGGAYDEGHLEILKVVAAQTSVALENARLFAEDQKRLRHISFLHAVTRIAISTLNPEEMLAEIAREIQKNFAYDYLGIGLIDYQAREVEVKAEAGLRAQALGRRFPLDSGLIGSVTRSGEPVVLQQVSLEDRLSGVLSNLRSAVCLPITYGDQMLGVLNIESLTPNAFPHDDLPILRTLADHLATALHNALTFQQTQEQAITDGLTGAKTHRYFKEALHAEWKRCTRAGRIFSLLVLDLDRFKQINDTHGHLEGDLVLARLGRILDHHCRQSNVVARYGGDEFMILMPETSTEQAAVLAERLRLAVATDPMFAKRRLTGSFGIATFPVHGHTAEEMVRAADAGMYLSKHHGGNRVSVAEQFRQGQAERWRSNVFATYLEGLTRRLDSTGPELLEGLIKRIEEAWETYPGDSQELIYAITEGLATIAELLLDRVHGGHGSQARVVRYILLLAQSLRLSEAQVQHIRIAARLHDIGYLAIPAEVLSRNSRLNPAEFAAFHVHAGAGARLLAAVHLPADVIEIVRHHHEQVNGRGYPDGLTADRIPLGGRMLGVVDAYCAITSDRPFRKARSPEEALDELERFSGAQFDEMIVRTFVELIQAELREAKTTPHEQR